MSLSPLVRAALFVRDIEVSTAFYRMLGFTGIYYEGVLDPASTAGALHVPETTVCTCRILKHEGGANYGMLGLFQLREPVPPPVQRTSGSPHLGEVAIVFYADNIPEILARAPSFGAQEVWDPITFVMPHRSQDEVCLRDPDGILINLIGRDPAEAYRTEPVSPVG
jgi:catechol 2,3-dioxygenase-like lactoylglutathione lyase family enzyme